MPDPRAPKRTAVELTESQRDAVLRLSDDRLGMDLFEFRPMTDDGWRNLHHRNIVELDAPHDPHDGLVRLTGFGVRVRAALLEMMPAQHTAAAR